MEEQQVQLTEEQQEVQAPQKKSFDLDYGFVVGINKEGGIVFDMVGAKKGLVEMLGLCKYAEYHLNHTLDAASGQGMPILSQQVHQLAEMMKVLLNMLAQRKTQENQSRIVTP